MFDISRFMCNLAKNKSMSSIGSILKESRKNIGFTLRQVEEALDISNAYLSQLENDKIKNPSANILYKLSNLYRIPLKSLLSNAGIIDKQDEENTSKNSQFIQKVAFSAENLSDEEKREVLKYLEFIKTHRKI